MQQVRGDVVTLLGMAPFHRWEGLRALVKDSELAAFDAAAERVRAGWTSQERQAQLRACVTAVAAEAVLALPDWNGEEVLSEHLDNAMAALRAARALTGPDPG